MTTILFIVGLLGVLVLWLAVVPVVILADTESNCFKIWQPGTIYFRVQWSNGPVVILRVLGFRVPLRSSSSGKVNNAKQVKKKKEPAKSPAQWWSLFRDLARCFRIRQCVLNVDTGDVVLNARLVPVAMLLSQGTGKIRINFVNEVSLFLNARFYPAMAVYSFLRFYFKH